MSNNIYENKICLRLKKRSILKCIAGIPSNKGLISLFNYYMLQTLEM